ncbi:hypothetical protein [Ruminococcus sp.]|uniref:hypothetical protein n=1 Tax=Ruminococcus sp. TaxID=41978 RepID=UPI0025E8108D|nr:hypothetical protein [Ruminococcus sp.]
MSENEVVYGVECSIRPVWLTTLSTAASIVLIAGIAIGSSLMIRKNNHYNIPDTPLPPAITASTIKSTETTNISTDRNGSSILTTFTTASGIKSSTDISVTETVKEIVTTDTPVVSSSSRL